MHITMKGDGVETVGDGLVVGARCPDFTLCQSDLSDFRLTEQAEPLFLNIFPSLDTAVCAASVREFNRLAAVSQQRRLLCISADLPFAQHRFCSTEGIENATTLSCFRETEFGRQLGLTIATGPLRGLLARAVIVLDASQQVEYIEIVSEITNEPNYALAGQYL